MYLRIDDDGTIESASELPGDVLSLVDNGAADFIRVNDDGDFERLAFYEPENGHGPHRARWEVID